MNSHVLDSIEYITSRRIEILSKENERRLHGQRISAEREKNFDKFRCHECGLPHAMQFIVHDEVWALAKFPRTSFVCFPCFVRAMPRPLTIEDFKQCLTNEMIFHGYAMGEQAAKNAQNKG